MMMRAHTSDLKSKCQLGIWMIVSHNQNMPTIAFHKKILQFLFFIFRVLFFFSLLVHHQFPADYFRITSSPNTTVVCMCMCMSLKQKQKGNNFLRIWHVWPCSSAASCAAQDIYFFLEFFHASSYHDYIIAWSSATFRKFLLTPETNEIAFIVNGHTASQEVIEPFVCWP